MINKTILHYKIIEKLGEGGMGVVYKAEDTKLEREVAIKFLPSNITSNSDERERFKIEAKAAAALNHPNITTIHAIEEFNGEMFIVMEYINGVELKQEITSNPLPLNRVIDITTQIATGLKAAHDKGIIHRDIKSANIMITESDQVKVMDFGLAKIQGSEIQLTKEHSTLGTAAYMSPEQTNGESVDHRTDIWSFGIVLYEMLSGKMPFKGDYDQAVIYSILNEEPKAITSINENVPNMLEEIVKKSLKKNFLDRYQDLDELISDLRKLKNQSDSDISLVAPVKTKKENRSGDSKVRKITGYAIIGIVSALLIFFLYQWQSGSGGVKTGVLQDSANANRKKIVVLPFENLGPPEDQYFADGMTDEINTSLARLKGLNIIAPRSARQYRHTIKSPQIIGKELGVDYLMEGTVRWQRSIDGSSRVRITPQLIRTSDATQIWTEVYEKDLTDIFAIQAYIAEEVAASLDITILESQRKVLADQPTKNMEAYNYYLRGSYLIDRDELKSTFFEAVKMYEMAVELDPLFAKAWARLSTAHGMIFWFHYDRLDERMIKSKIAVDRAFKLEPELPETHKAMGDYYYFNKEYDMALKQYTIARKGLGENSELLSSIGYVKRRQSNMKEAEDYLHRAFKLNPRSPQNARNIGETLMMSRNYQKAEQFFDLTISISPAYQAIYSLKIHNILLWKGDTEQASKLLDISYRLFPVTEEPTFVYREILLLICTENYQKALKRLSELTRESVEFQLLYTPKSLYKAQIHQLNKTPELAKKEYKIALKILKNRIKKSPHDSRLHSSLGITFAGLGKKELAVKEGKHGVELMPVKREAYKGFYRLIDLALIYTMVGSYEKAIDMIEYLLSLPGYFSLELLRIDPRWDPLRNHPRFIKLLREGKQYTYMSNDK